MIVHGKKLSFSSARITNNSFGYEASTNHDVLYARAERNKALDALRAKKEMFEQEVAELASCERLTVAQQKHMQSLKKRIALLSETLVNVR